MAIENITINESIKILPNPTLALSIVQALGVWKSTGDNSENGILNMCWKNENI